MSKLQGSLQKALAESEERLRPVLDGQPLGAITLSEGVAVFPVHGLGLEPLLRAAAAAMYAAKQAGRDRVCAAGDA